MAFSGAIAFGHIACCPPDTDRSARMTGSDQVMFSIKLTVIPSQALSSRWRVDTTTIDSPLDSSSTLATPGAGAAASYHPCPATPPRKAFCTSELLIRVVDKPSMMILPVSSMYPRSAI